MFIVFGLRNNDADPTYHPAIGSMFDVPLYGAKICFGGNVGYFEL